MREIKFKLVKEYKEYKKKQRFYEASLPLTKSAGMKKDIHLREAMIEERKTIREEFRHLIPDDIDGVRLICISDAHTHTERLVFAGLKVGNDYARLGLQINGKHTFMTNGGNDDDIYDDKVYLRHLSKLSGYQYAGISNETPELLEGNK